MGELSNIFKERYGGKRRAEAKERQTTQKVKNFILKMCDRHLVEAGEVLTFEVQDRLLPATILVIAQEPLISKYMITQVNRNLFTARVKELEL